MDAYYFIKYFPDGFDNYFDKIKGCQAIFTFDLEDSIQDVDSLRKTQKLKKTYRRYLSEIYKQNNDIFSSPVAVRLNKPGSQEFSRDIRALSLISGINWKTIIIPKVESPESLEFAIHALQSNSIQFDGIGALIESSTGVCNLDDIIRVQPYLTTVIFGHADYNLDQGFFPFIHQHDELYWTVVKEITEKLAGSGITFVNSPCLHLSNDQLFLHSLDRLYSLRPDNIGQLTLTLNQSLLCKAHQPHPYTAENKIIMVENPGKKLDQAKRLIDLFKVNNVGKSFSINQDMYLVSPHEYLQASRIVRDHTSHES